MNRKQSFEDELRSADFYQEFQELRYLLKFGHNEVAGIKFMANFKYLKALAEVIEGV